MRDSVFITGATGLLGANVCEIAVSQGRRVRALVRHEDDARVLGDLGVETVFGDLTDKRALASAMQGMDAVFHAAAVVGGTWSKATDEDFWTVNYRGTSNVMDAAKAAGVGRQILVSSFVIFDSTETITEASPILPIAGGGSSYTRSKRASYYESMHRACLGENIAFLVPGCIYGPSPNVDRALVATSFTSMILRGITGELADYADFPMNWVYVPDIAKVALGAVDDDEIGARYLGVGRGEDECSVPALCNKAAKIAGSPHRVAATDLSAPAKSGGGSFAGATRTFGTPTVDGRATQAKLGIPATSLDDGLAATVEWLRRVGKI